MSNIKITVKKNVYTLIINRPNNYNALNINVLKSLDKNLDKIYKDKNAKAVIITGSGNKSFIAGADIKEMSKMNRKTAFKFSQYGQELTSKIENFPIPVIAAINGYALGGGCELAMSCHIRYASQNAIFGQPEVSLGLIAGFGGTQRLQSIIGKSQALEILLSGVNISAADALKYGLINKVTNSDKLMIEVDKLCSNIVKNAPLSIKATLKSVNYSINNSFTNSLRKEREEFSELFESSDAREGMNAFIEKRKPLFKSE